jgi:hypothetical protein
VQSIPDSTSVLHHTTAEELIKIIASDWIDYSHIARFDGQRVIINVLWEMNRAETNVNPNNESLSEAAWRNMTPADANVMFEIC